MLYHCHNRGCTAKWNTTRKHLEENDPQRIDIGARIYCFANSLFWRKIFRRAKNGTSIGQGCNCLLLVLSRFL